MTTKRLVILQIVLLLGLSCVYVLPARPNSQPSGVELKLPTLVGDWFGKESEITEKEHQVLGPETEFARKLYTNKWGDEIFVSIVLAGQDMNTSIHRPERCLPAQGWIIADSRVVDVPLDDGATLKITRLHDMRPIHTTNGGSVNLYNLNYYWFVGYNDITPSHITRNFYDIRDRLLKGYNQRWAYVTVAATVTKGFKENGKSEEEIDAMIREFVKNLAPKIHKPSVKYG